MGKYNDIWTRVKGFEETKKTRKKKSREEKIKEVECSTIGEGVGVSDVEDVE